MSSGFVNVETSPELKSNKLMKMRSLKIGISLLVIAFCAARFNAQSADVDQVTDEEQTKAENVCRQIPMREERTYTFRRLPKEPVLRGAYAAPKWYQRLFPFLLKPDKTPAMVEIEEEIGRPIPLGETKRSQKIRANSETKLVEVQKNAEQHWQNWLKQNPNAAKKEIEAAEIRIRFQGLAAADLERFDWRENGLNVGAAGFQGFRCQSCWAFTAVDAMQISRRLAALRTGRTDFSETPRPSVQQLISCMMPDKKEDFCKVGWHGSAFTFLVDKGLPLGGPVRYDEKDAPTWTCDSDAYVKALTWDFVSRDPRKVSTTEEIKRALILYGPLVTMMYFDKCLWLYGGGTFNGENTGDGNHFVLIVGWDDKKGAWLVKNSFGMEWGEIGFGWVKYGSNRIGESTAWVMADPEEEERVIKEFVRQEEK